MTRFFWKRFIGAWLIALFSLQLTRLVFYLNLKSYFDGSFAELFSAFLFGIEFDAVTIAYLLGPFFIVLPFVNGGKPLSILKWYFVLVLSGMSLLNCVDAEFFRFTARRSTDDLFELAFLSNDIVNIAPSLIGHFWHLLAAAFLVFLIVLFFSNRLFDNERKDVPFYKKLVALIPTAAFLLLGARGGFHPIPLTIIDAGNTDQPHLSAVALSTPFTIIKTIGKPELKRYSFEGETVQDINPIAQAGGSTLSGRFKGQNVVVIIVESLSTEYVGALNGLEVGYTPFLDSLIQQSMVFENAFANGHRSIEGIAAITASIPTLMYEPYTTSRYAGNKITSLANVLRTEGYYTSFMHGGNKNSMNFESYCGQAGFNLFYDRDDYPQSNEHYDGVWGISDHYMLNHCIDKYTEFNKPFFSSIFTLSSHHPYTIPEEYKDRFPKGTLPIHESIGYADESLKEFFQKAITTDWFENTLFVITADHTSLSEHQAYQTKLGSLRIPILLYHPTDSLLMGRNKTVMQQIDIMPTILDLLGYENQYFTFGVSAFDQSSTHSAIAFKHDQHQLYAADKLICFDGEKTTFVYNVSTDELLHKNLVDNPDEDYNSNEAYLKGFMENYSKALIENKMTYETWSNETP